MFGTHYRIERKSIALAVAIMVVASIGGLIEVAPLFTIDDTVESESDMRVYTPLELAGRHIYIRECCYACHSQMFRQLQAQVERYRSYEQALDSSYDHTSLRRPLRTCQAR